MHAGKKKINICNSLLLLQLASEKITPEYETMTIWARTQNIKLALSRTKVPFQQQQQKKEKDKHPQQENEATFTVLNVICGEVLNTKLLVQIIMEGWPAQSWSHCLTSNELSSQNAATCTANKTAFYLLFLSLILFCFFHLFRKMISEQISPPPHSTLKK